MMAEEWRDRMWCREIPARDGKKCGTGLARKTHSYKQLTNGQLKKCRPGVEQN